VPCPHEFCGLHQPNGVLLCKLQKSCVTSRHRRGVNENFVVLECYAALIGSQLPTFRNNLSVPSSRVK